MKWKCSSLCTSYLFIRTWQNFTFHHWISGQMLLIFWHSCCFEMQHECLLYQEKKRYICHRLPNPCLYSFINQLVRLWMILRSTTPPALMYRAYWEDGLNNKASVLCVFFCWNKTVKANSKTKTVFCMFVRHWSCACRLHDAQCVCLQF